jgi:hypothetical protein
MHSRKLFGYQWYVAGKYCRDMFLVSICISEPVWLLCVVCWLYVAVTARSRKLLPSGFVSFG